VVFGIKYFTNNYFQPAIKPLFNGNIAETFWQTGSDVNVRKYGYKYDTLNRLQNAIYQKPNEVVQIYNSYNENLWYDKNGNITRLERDGEVDDPVNKYTIDNLTYIYHSVNKNQLTIVDDATNITHGFKDDDTNPNPAAIDSSTDYAYDNYGNMKMDTNKGITQILYNHQNLPIKITLSNGIIEYLYNAAGVKVQKKVTIGTTIYTTDYQSGYQYLNTELQFFPHAEGYVNVVNGDRFNYVYNYTDHLGNIRVSYGLDPESNVLKILEENHYYPFGMKHKNYGVDLRTYRDNGLGEIRLPLVSEVSYKYKYNGKEYQDELGLNFYDYGARNYDPALGRWMNIDPLAEKYFNISPYNYVADNPIIFIDPDGKEIIVANKADQAKVLKMINSQAVGTFAFNKEGKLYLAKAGGDTSKYSQYYTDKLIQAIGKNEKIEIKLLEKVIVNAPDGNLEINLDTRQYGGAATFGSVGTDQLVLVSENDWDAEVDESGNKLVQTPADKLMHELVGHAIPKIVGSDTGDAIKNENKVREQTKSPKRKEVPHDE
jgi:RHS repeat-associated protein